MEQTKEFWDDMRWGEEHISELLKKFPDKWVAVVGRTVAASGESISKVEEEAEKKTGRGRDQIPVIFVERGSHIY